MVDIPVKLLNARIKEIVASSDHNTLTVKRIRLQLEQEFGVDLSSRKAEIQTRVDACLCGNEKISDTDEASEDSSTPHFNLPAGFGNAAYGHSSGNFESNSNSNYDSNSDSDNDSENGGTVNHSKRAKTSKPQPKSKSRRSEPVNEVDDAEMARRLSVADVYGLRHSRSSAAATPKRKAGATKRESGERATSGFQKPVLVSEQLSALLGGERQLSRPEIVKRIWDVVKQRGLLDTRNRQFAVCDTQLAELFGRARVRMFGMMKLLKRHITPL